MSQQKYNKTKGSLWERTVADYLNSEGAFGGHVERAPRWGALDKGDLLNTGRFTVECKAVKEITLSTFVDEAEIENVNTGRDWPLVIIKRRMRPPSDAYCVLPAWALVEIVRELEGHVNATALQRYAVSLSREQPRRYEARRGTALAERQNRTPGGSRRRG